DCARN
ncbi:hypothetical protein BV111_00406B, partial [Haemophilus influenzae]